MELPKTFDKLRDFRLTSDERKQLADLVSSQTWAILQKIRTHMLEAAVTACVSMADDHRFHQGFYAGIASVFDGIEAVANPPGPWKMFSPSHSAGEL